MDVEEAAKVTTGSSSSLIFKSSDVLDPSSTFAGFAIETKIVSIGSSFVSWSPVRVTVAL